MSYVWLLLIGAVLYFVWRSRSRGADTRQPFQRDRAPSSQPDWLAERWAMAQGASEVFPAWYFDAPTEAQLARMQSEGLRSFSGMTKGQASDLIGTKVPAEEDDLEALRFFKRPTRGMNETRARHELAVIFQRVENREAWKKRPPSARAKEDCRFLGVKLNADSTHADATAAVKSRYMELEGSGDSLAARFDAYSGVLDDFADASFREEYAMKKPSYSQIRAAIESLAGEGATWEIACNAGDVADRLLEMYPGLAR